ncbi:hypothetical protein MOOR_27560 [Moorella thermoacetica]|uniref:DUF362 domain-containing protein n=3 Tax=Neomoorella thermoacetica TaxID=1525 RepID=A0A1J5JQA4_NEOTH|nr:hypothetical protein MOOR_27560 [Moorella thermoacetica]
MECESKRKVIEMIFPDLFNEPFPKMVRARQKFEVHEVTDLAGEIEKQFSRPEIASTIKPGQRIAVLAGSRGVSRYNEIVKKVVEEVKKRGAYPFIVPAMGSHGGATPEGQISVLASLGITEESMGVPILSDMNPVVVGYHPTGEPIYFDSNAYEADAVIPVNRVKPHTAFRAEHESGLIKMLTIGAGKQKGASMLHWMGPDRFGTILVDAFRVIRTKVPVIFGIATVEDAYEHVAHIEAIPVAEIEQREAELLRKAWAMMPRILIDEFDVLIIDEIGKNISGDGMDPNIIGRYCVDWLSGGPSYQRLVVLGLTPETRGNALGIGMADVIPRHLYDILDYQQMYMNAYTSKIVLGLVKVPMVVENDKEAIAVGLRTCLRVKPGRERVIRIKNTLNLAEIQISEVLIDKARAKGIEIIGEPKDMQFDEAGNLV